MLYKMIDDFKAKNNLLNGQLGYRKQAGLKDSLKDKNFIRQSVYEKI